MAGDEETSPRVLLTGATGYIGGRLIPVLRERGVRLRCMARRPEHLRGRVPDDVEVVGGDALVPDSLRAPLEGVDVAYYLIHSMGSEGDFEQRDRRAAENFGRAAREAGVGRVVYLGGLGAGDDDEALSEHLRSRQDVGRILRESGVPTVEFRASIIVGSGSLSFEMVRALTERLPVMICPRWVATPTQPIAIEDVIAYLVAALDRGADDAVYEIGGAEVVSYGDLMQEYARQRGLLRVMIPVPVLTPRLSSLWLNLVTPLYASVGRKLVDGLRNPTVVRDDRALRVFDVEPRGVRHAIARALVNEDDEFARTRWSDALSAGGEEGSEPGWGGTRFRSRRVDSRVAEVAYPPRVAFRPIRRIGGDRGWYYADPLWRLRGLMDLLVGGVGLRRGRRDPESPHVGDTLDFWRVQAYEPDRRLLLRAEMKVPGRAWLQFEVEERPGGGSRVRQTAVFDPVGLLGLGYWYALYPFHGFIFEGMLRRIVQAMERVERVEPDAEAVRA